MQHTEGRQPQVDLRVATIGNVDSGKSTLVGVLTRVRPVLPLSLFPTAPTSPTVLRAGLP
jgi:hypothetical protein